MVLEYANGGGIVQLPIEMAADGTTSLGAAEDWTTSDTYDTFQAESDAARSEAQIITSHCGPVPFYVDFDGSLWDPSGTVDLTPLEPLGHVDRKVTVRLTSPETAEVTGRRGFRLELVRHEGAKGLQAGCS